MNESKLYLLEYFILNLTKTKKEFKMGKQLNNKMKNNFFYSEPGLSVSMLFKKLCEYARIYSNDERIIN